MLPTMFCIYNDINNMKMNNIKKIYLPLFQNLKKKCINKN